MNLRPHRLWLSLFTLAVIIIAGSGPALDMAREKAVLHLAETKAAHAKADENLRQLQADVEAARKLNRQIDRAHAEEVLAPADRLKAAVMLEKEAGSAKLAPFSPIPLLRRSMVRSVRAARPPGFGNKHHNYRRRCAGGCFDLRLRRPHPAQAARSGTGPAIVRFHASDRSISGINIHFDTKSGDGCSNGGFANTCRHPMRAIFHFLCHNYRF